MTALVPVFFYGLYMDPDLLREHGVTAVEPTVAEVGGYALRIGKRAALIVDASSSAHGVVAWLTHDDLDCLYADPSLVDYRPMAVLATSRDGRQLPALCYNLPTSPSPDDHNAEYAERLRVVAGKVGLDQAYIDRIG